MLAFRRLAPTDLSTVTDLAVRALAPSAQYGLTIDRQKLHGMVWGFAHDDSHFHLAAFNDNKAVGAVAMYVLPSPLFVGLEAHIIIAYAEHRLAGHHLLESMSTFLRGNTAIKRAIWCMNDAAGDPRAAAFSRLVKRRYGFRACHDNLVWNRGA